MLLVPLAQMRKQACWNEHLIDSNPGWPQCPFLWIFWTHSPWSLMPHLTYHPMNERPHAPPFLYSLLPLNHCWHHCQSSSKKYGWFLWIKVYTSFFLSRWSDLRKAITADIWHLLPLWLYFSLLLNKPITYHKDQPWFLWVWLNLPQTVGPSINLNLKTD